MKMLFLAPSSIHPLGEHILKGSLGGPILIYSVWHKTTPNNS
jgi:hypothetical protein